MFGKIEGFISSFIPRHLRRQVRELFASTIILNFALSMVNIFEPVFIFLFFSQKYDSMHALLFVLVFYLIVYVGYLFAVPLGAKFAKKFGYEFAIAFGCIFTAIFYFCLFAINISAWFFIPAIIVYVLWKMLYWPAYHANFSRFSVDGEQGREVGNMVVLESLVFVLAPLVGGILIKFMGFKALFILSAIIMILSNVPMLLTKEKLVSSSFSYRDAFQRLFARKNFKKLIAFCGYGEELIVLVVWPIAMYLIVEDFFELGALAAIATFVTIALFLFIGKLTDKTNPRKVLRFGAVLYFFGWMFRLLAGSVLGVFLVDTYSRITKQAISVPIVAETYHEGKHTSEMETVLFYEMGLVLGKIIAIIIAVVLVLLFGASWNALFILAGLMGLLYLLF